MPVNFTSKCFVLLLALLPGVLVAGTTEVPVSVGGSAEFDACGSWAVVSGLKPGGDGFLAVRSGPGTAYRLRDRLAEGQGFYVCDQSRDSTWVGIVYPRSGQEQSECGVHGSIVAARSYTGPCRFGWVHRRWVNVIAG